MAPVITELVRAIMEDTSQILPISSLMEGQLGMSDVSVSLPCIAGAKGREQVLDPRISEFEREALISSYNVLRGVIQEGGP